LADDDDDRVSTSQKALQSGDGERRGTKERES
jgi:hypothetical protein